jgi:hypothetical protein
MWLEFCAAQSRKTDGIGSGYEVNWLIDGRCGEGKDPVQGEWLGRSGRAPRRIDVQDAGRVAAQEHGRAASLCS